MSHIHWGVWGTGTPKVEDRHEVSQKEEFYFEQQINRDLKRIHICHSVGVGEMKD